MMASTLILASKSVARQSMLTQAGVSFTAQSAAIDERALEQIWGALSPAELAARLAAAKAGAVSARYPGVWVIGSDQVLSLGPDILSKAASASDAEEKLKSLRGKTHTLTSAVCLMRDGAIAWQTADAAHLTVKNFSDDFLSWYLTAAGAVLMDCVGAYAIEGIGLRLFEKIEGDYFTILGMPLLPLLTALQQRGIIA